MPDDQQPTALTTHQPPPALVAAAAVSGMAAYRALVAEADADHQAYWARLARQFISWKTPFTQVLDDSGAPFFKWFADGTLNVSHNCLDRNVERGLADRTAIIFEADDGAVTRVSYSPAAGPWSASFANALKARGVKQGRPRRDLHERCRVEGVAAMQACARIGAIALGGLRRLQRTQRARPRAGRRGRDGHHRRRTVARRQGPAAEGHRRRRHRDARGCETLAERASSTGAPAAKINLEPRASTAGCTKRLAMQPAAPANPNGSAPSTRCSCCTPAAAPASPRACSTAPAATCCTRQLTTAWTFDLKDDDVFWCTADIGWVTGHSYIAYGPLALGGTEIVFEGVPTYPDAARFWKTIEKHKVSGLLHRTHRHPQPDQGRRGQRRPCTRTRAT